MTEEFRDFLREPLIEVGGAEITIVAVLTAIAIIVIARLIAALLSRGLHRLFARRGVDSGVDFAVAKIVRWSAMIVGALVALTTIGMNMSAVLAVLAVLLVGIGFGLQKVAENFISGLILLVERPLRVGDFVAVETVKGTIVDIGLRATKITTRDGLTHLVPNSDLIAKQVTNYTSPSTRLRIWVPVGVAYGTDLAMASDALLDVAAHESLVLADPPPQVRHNGFGESGTELALVVWIADADDDDEATSALRFAIDRAFAARGLTIPVPQRELHIKPPAARPPMRAGLHEPQRTRS